MNFFKRRKILKNANVLTLVPLRKMEHKQKEGDKVTLIVPKFKNEILNDLLIPKSKPRHHSIHLDILGSFLWKHIDGEKNIEQICDILYENHTEEFKDRGDAIDRATKYVSMLYEQRYITFRELVR